jgi:hypothetical protein
VGGLRDELGVAMEERPERDQVSELDELMRQTDESGRRLRNIQIGATLVLVAVFAIGLSAIYGQGRSMYTAEKIQASLPPQVEALQPALTSTLRQVVDAAGPHYARLGQERLDAVLPKVATALEAELVGLSTGLARGAERRVAEALARVEQTQLEKIQSLYPELDRKRFETLRAEWATDIHGDTELVLADFQGRVLTDFTLLSNTIESFGPNQYDDFGRNELVRYYAHLWLTLIDIEVMNADNTEVRDG